MEPEPGGVWLLENGVLGAESAGFRGSRSIRILFIDSPRDLAQAGSVELETVFETLNASEAQLIRSRLEAAGLHPEVDPEIDPLPTGPILIKVPGGEAAEAQALLAEMKKGEA